RGDHRGALAASVVPLSAGRLPHETLFSQVFEDLPLALLVLQTSLPLANPFGALFRLTAAEIALVEALAQGQSLQAYADLKQVTINTVRTQLKAIFLKTNTHRQGELIAMFMASATPKAS
ncbi:MAG TPA: helix-turn-helix transcriptional regulator, partial [Devosia sp.]|nr:helix-turn-helix transcriptional regulator [Devosia sp.]